MRGAAPRLRGWPAAAVAGLALALGAIAFAQNQRAVSGLSWPGLDIQFREMAAAQTLLDQGYGPDANYLNEHVWYNPMTSWIIAGASALSGRPVNAVITGLGPYLNLAAPASLFLLTATAFDAYCAIAAMAAFVFLIGTQFTFYEAATYSPWFAPESYGQAWLYLVLVSAARAFWPAASRVWAVACGALLGLTFLTHTAPALIGGAVVVMLAVVESRRLGARESATLAGVALAVAFVVSLPFVAEILWRYRLRIVNEFPGLSPSTILDLNELPGLLGSVAIPLGVAAAAFGLRAAKALDAGLRLILIWATVVVALLMLHVGRLLLAKAGVHVTPVVPGFHFFSYLLVIAAIGLGVAVRDASAAVARWGAALSRTPPERAAALPGLVACIVTLSLVAVGYPRYLQRPDFTELRARAVSMNERVPVDVLDWIRAHTSSDDVFLCTDDASLYVVPAAGRKVVATNRYFSNPYVDWASRDADRSRMYAHLARPDLEEFFAIASEYRVRFVLLTRDRSREWLRPAGLVPRDLPDIDPATLAALPAFERVFESPRFAILKVRSEAG